MRMTKAEKELFEKRFLEAMKKRDALIKAGRKALREARAEAKRKRYETV